MMGEEVGKWRLRRTKNCIRCKQPATSFCGYVQRLKDKVIAGWCEGCFSFFDEDKGGFQGEYTPDME